VSVRAGWAASALALAACSGAPLPSELDRAQALEAARDDAGALAAWRAIRASCPEKGARPHDDCGLAATREAQLEERLGRFADAARDFELVADRSIDPRKAARGLARAAAIAAGELHDEARAVRDAWSCVERWPDEVPADDALTLAVRIEKRRDPQALLTKLDALSERLTKEDIADNLLYDAGEVALGAGDEPGAIARWDLLDQRFPRSPLRDDANWRAAAILRARKDGKGAVERLERILRTRRDALIVGSYNSVWLDDAQLEIGRVWLDDLHDPARAEEAFALLADDYPESTLRDDGLFELARARLARHTPPTETDVSGACRALDRLIEQFPDGNRARAAKEERARICSKPTL
jgi:hypothetical protein